MKTPINLRFKNKTDQSKLMYEIETHLRNTWYSDILNNRFITHHIPDALLEQLPWQHTGEWLKNSTDKQLFSKTLLPLDYKYATSFQGNELDQCTFYAFNYSITWLANHVISLELSPWKLGRCSDSTDVIIYKLSSSF